MAAGTGPNGKYAYPSPSDIDADLAIISKLNANTILVYDPPDYVLDLAAKHGLKVLYTFSLDWWSVGGPQQAAVRARVVSRVKALRSNPALLGWVLGNEVPSGVLDTRGEAVVVQGIEDLFRAVKQADPEHPITHSNWPITRDLPLGFLDFVSFNLYPLWPPEVAARGFGNYVSQVLEPLARGKPLLITEFGVNTLEASADDQSRILNDCWAALRRANAAGGVVFEFADEWWKNYDNPRRAGDWWNRQPAPDDEKRHDADPEEYYGIMTAERTPKPAFFIVQRMFGAPNKWSMAEAAPVAAVAALILMAAGTWTWAAARRQSARRL
jgi:exo-beta-1,3-glucanase (GH17 family)